ncbi:hypothetical protein B0H14DRAFT_3486722 [Mycena olivaceomarginata]|nr:hypothetical protein B0H14DRAFT_3486722 [Mycena olivaceomarginata]
MGDYQLTKERPYSAIAAMKGTSAFDDQTRGRYASAGLCAALGVERRVLRASGRGGTAGARGGRASLSCWVPGVGEVRLSSRRGSAVGRRRSSLATAAFAKPGTYGYTPPPVSPPLTFAPNVTPISYSAPSPSPSPFGSPSLTTDQPLPCSRPAPHPRRRLRGDASLLARDAARATSPRPPNAFMLFRRRLCEAEARPRQHRDQSRQPEQDHRSATAGAHFPLPEKHIWETKAKHAKAEHKLKYPDYKFPPGAQQAGPRSCPLYVRATFAAGLESASGATDERRCEEVAALLLQGKKELAQSSPSPPYHHNSKFPSPLNLDPMYYPQVPASPPSSALTSSQASGSGAGSPYAGHIALDQARDQTWRHRRSSSVPLPNDYSYTFPPFMYGESDGMGITLPPIGFPSQQPGSTSTDSPSPTAELRSLAGPQVSISGNAPACRSRGPARAAASPNPRPSFSFARSLGARGSFSFAGAFGGAWGGNSNGPVGRRASSAQAYFSQSSFAGYSQHQQQQQQGEEELPDADTSLFDSGFLNSFGGGGFADGFLACERPRQSVRRAAQQQQQQQQQTLHAPQPVHAMSPLAVELQQQQGQQQYEHGAEQQALDAGASYVEADVAAPSSYVDDASEPQQHAEEAQQQEQSHKELEYPPFEFPTEEPLGFASSIDMSRRCRGRTIWTCRMRTATPASLSERSLPSLLHPPPFSNIHVPLRITHFISFTIFTLLPSCFALHPVIDVPSSPSWILLTPAPPVALVPCRLVHSHSAYPSPHVPVIICIYICLVRPARILPYTLLVPPATYSSPSYLGTTHASRLLTSGYNMNVETVFLNFNPSLNVNLTYLVSIEFIFVYDFSDGVESDVRMRTFLCSAKQLCFHILHTGASIPFPPFGDVVRACLASYSNLSFCTAGHFPMKISNPTSSAANNRVVVTYTAEPGDPQAFFFEVVDNGRRLDFANRQIFSGAGRSSRFRETWGTHAVSSLHEAYSSTDVVGENQPFAVGPTYTVLSAGPGFHNGRYTHDPNHHFFNLNNLNPIHSCYSDNRTASTKRHTSTEHGVDLSFTYALVHPLPLSLPRWPMENPGSILGAIIGATVAGVVVVAVLVYLLVHRRRRKKQAPPTINPFFAFVARPSGKRRRSFTRVGDSIYSPTSDKTPSVRRSDIESREDLAGDGVALGVPGQQLEWVLRPTQDPPPGYNHTYFVLGAYAVIKPLRLANLD